MSDDIPLRPFLPADTMALRELYAQSIEELTKDDYNEDQRVAWASLALDADAFGARLKRNLTLVVELDGELMGFASMKDGATLDMIYVHPYHAGLGVGTTLLAALEKLAAARGKDTVTVEASDSAVEFFEARGYVATSRNLVPIEDEWLSFSSMSKALSAASAKAAQ